MNKIIIATKNKGKVNEFEALLAPLGYQVQSLLDYPDAIDVEETGSTFEANAILKAEAISKQYGMVTIADDSGLEVDYLNGQPGVYSARYAGTDKSDQANMEKVLKELSAITELEKRSARFICALALSTPGHVVQTVRGACEGFIAETPTGENGFGYDPIFILQNSNKTMAQLSKEEKNKVSHRSDALKKLIELIS
ncbi:XTP/dITP diphosphatase [Metabacillus litoralis]|uniref:dITP/XTP pyrophosphatase n=1 Tax=Metabacillus litoralis TaxID=152268 RepID=A0A5C6VZU1_9BACI|nr:XTP/dITP diphosphatase [Metabacillus litoralis]TXC90139.1 XTP/dITP diphosphatase [Metabacillus litoralis]